MKKLMVFMLLISLSTVDANAAKKEFATPSKNKADVKVGRYVLEKSHANIFFFVSHLGFSNFYSKFTDFTAVLNANPNDLTKSSVEVTINTATADSGNGILNEKYKGEDFFNVNKFPTAIFKSTKLELKTDTTGTLTGDLTLLGVTKPITLDVIYNGTGFNPYAGKNMLGFSAKGKINRSDFGMNSYIPAVSDEVNLIIEAEFIFEEDKKYPKKDK
jgi:polyisoprenoid-binding protein YceI